MRDDIEKELLKLQGILHVDQSSLQSLIFRVTNNPLVLRDEGTTDHFCSFFIPFDKQVQKLYLIHHKKADAWIPPGGHIDRNETPIDAVKREYKEELGESLIDEHISLFNISSLHISPTRPTCIVHNDLWYVVFVKEHEYTFCEGEAYAAGWFSIDDAIKKVNKVPLFVDILRTLPQFLKTI